jgi:hypothetical protein
MIQHHKYSLTEIEGMIPYEFDIYIELLCNYIKEMEDRNRQINK